MTDQTIPPALTPEEWELERDRVRDLGWALYLEVGVADGDEAKVIALTNAALPNSDPRKITRERIAELRECARNWGGMQHSGGSGPTVWRNRLTEQFGEHPPRIFHEGGP